MRERSSHGKRDIGEPDVVRDPLPQYADFCSTCAVEESYLRAERQCVSSQSQIEHEGWSQAKIADCQSRWAPVSLHSIANYGKTSGHRGLVTVRTNSLVS